MSEYTELVEALRERARRENEWYEHGGDIINAAADAIEALQAENPIVETVLVDKMRQQMEETVCHCNVKENAELIAKILDDDVDGKVFELPERGEWKRVEDGETYHYECSECGERPLYSRFGDIVLSGVCPFCWAKMEVQDGK